MLYLKDENGLLETVLINGLLFSSQEQGTDKAMSTVKANNTFLKCFRTVIRQQSVDLIVSHYTSPEKKHSCLH